MQAVEVLASLLADMPSYGPDVNAAHEKTLNSLTSLPAWRLHYRDLGDAIRLLSELPMLPEAGPRPAG
jgi:hypothetical protein